MEGGKVDKVFRRGDFGGGDKIGIVLDLAAVSNKPGMGSGSKES